VRRAAALLAAVAVAFAPSVAAAAPGPSGEPEYWFDQWSVEQLWAGGARGQGITIAEIDTGVSVVPELSGRVLPGIDLGQQGGDGHVDREVDQFGHGTAMASIMVAKPGLLDITGVAPDAKILPIAVPLNGTTEQGQDDQLPRAIRYAVDHGAKIVNMSLGGKRSQQRDTQSCTDDEQEAIYYALAHGVIVTAAVGNTGPTRNVIEDPAVCIGVVAVGAVDSSGTVADFSNRQPYLTLVAPGVRVPSLSRVSGQAYYGDGTSQATAITSAVLALVWSKYPALSGRDVVARVLATLDDKRSKASSSYGYGRLDAQRAVTASVAPGGTNPVWAAAEPFLDRGRSLDHPAAAGPAPARAGRTGAPTGTYAIGSDPRWRTTRVLGGAGAVVAGLLALVALVVVGLRGRRRRLRATGAAAPVDVAPAVAPVPAERPRPRPYPDDPYRT
jgi:subtilisin family serine protease